MEIQELNIRSYGKFSGCRMTFQPGINVIYGGNESGKSTIHSFIRAMFFGLNRGRGRAALKDEYQLRRPWDAPGVFLGSMRIREDGEVYRIDRCFDRSAPPLTVVCETGAREYDSPQQQLDLLLGGISEAAFASTVFVAQAQCETDEALAQELRRYMVNSDQTMDGSLDVTRALQVLRKKKKKFEQQKKKEEEALEERIARKQAEADQLRQELSWLERQREAAIQRNRSGSAGGEEPDLPEEAVSPGIVTALAVLLLLAGVLCALGAFLLEGRDIRIFLGICAAVLLLASPAVRFVFGVGKGSRIPEEEESPEQEGPPELLRELENRKTAYRKLQDELELLYRRHVQPEGPETELAAITMAIDRICGLSDEIFQAGGGRLNETASQILAEITQGCYNRIVLDDMGEVRVHTPDRVLGLYQVSTGTMHQIYFALRMAAGELLENGKRLPLVLDEPFAMYDDTRLEAVLRWLKKSGRQVILFTCRSRERELVKKIGQ